MLKVLLFLVLTVTIFSSVTSLGICGPGRWLVLNIMDCENPEQYKIVCEVHRRKLNRTHDFFYGTVDLPADIDLQYGVDIEVYKEMDGGFKFFQRVSDEHACPFLMKYAEENVKRGLTNANVYPTDCPFRKGLINVTEFVMDYRELYKHGIYGKFEVLAYMLFGGEKVACMRLLLNFDVEEEYDEYDDEDDDIDDLL